MQFSERFNQHKLNYILQNKEKYNCRVTDDCYDPFGTASKLLLKSTNGHLKVNYHQPNNRNFGRFFADNSTSLQSLCREIRHSISSEYYDDLDMVNAHPVILRFLCGKHDIDCDKLNEYIENRDTHINELMVANLITKDDAKKAFLSLINGGLADYTALKQPTKFITRFKNELINILEEIVKFYPTEYELRNTENPTNPRGSTVNAIMCDYENNILQCILKFYKDKKIITDNCVMCFDGVMIPKCDGVNILIPECEAYILEKLKIKVNLKIKPMDEGFKMPEVVIEYTEYKPFDPRDPFCWLDFDEKYRGRTFTSEEEVIEQTRTDLNRVLCKVEQGCGFVVKKTDCKDNLIDIIDAKAAFTDLFFNFQCGDKTKEISFKRYIQLFSNSINRFRSIDFAPNNTDPYVFNLWVGYEAKEVKLSGESNDDFSPIEMILNHIKEIYCDNCEVSYNYFLDLIYYILKYPEKPLSIATFIYSKKQGSGKNIILDFLQKHVFGDNITYYTTGLETVLCSHNHLLKNKKIIVVDELASTSENFVGNFDKFKSMMSGLWNTINPKGTNQFLIKNVLCWFLISNHDDCIRIEQSDRRYFCLNVNEKYVGDVKYFKELGSKFTQENGDLFFTYIMNRGDARDVNISIPPMNAFKKSIISKSLSSSLRYLIELKESRYDAEAKEYKEYEDDDKEIKAVQLYNNYKDWCNNNHEKLKSNTKFSSDIKDNITKIVKRDSNYYDLSSIVN